MSFVFRGLVARVPPQTS